MSIYEDAAKKLAKEIDQEICNTIRSSARITQFIGKEDFIENLKRALEFLNRPEYYLVANPDNQEILESWVRSDKDLKIKVLYSPMVQSTELLLVKNGAVTATTYMEPCKVGNISREYKVNPDEVRVLRIK